MKELKAKEGYYLSDKDKTTFFKSVIGANINESDYIEIEESEVENIIKHNNAVKEINSIEKIDDYSYKAEIIPEVINNISMTNNEAVERKDLFPEWKAGIQVKVGEKYKYGDDLWEVVQSHTTQSDWIPSLSTASLWKRVDIEHSGTIDDPIPYEPPMEIFINKYYIQSDTLYKCTRDSGISLSQNLNDLVGLYVELV